jgi:HAD superfamily hydrolase (TIGR01548 family)
MTEKPLFIAPVPALVKLPRYSVGRPPYDTDLILDFNESLASLPLDGPPLDHATDVNFYPWTEKLEAQLAGRLEIEPERVIVTCGADDALERSVRSVCCPGRRAVMVKPTYGMPWRYAITCGVEIDTVEWWRGPVPVEEVCEAAEGAALLYLVSPNNPTGAVITRDEFTEIVRRLPETLVLHDQAYREFSDPEYDLTDIALDAPNVVLVRTFSKAWGGAGLRAGFAAGDVRVIDWLRRIGQPFPVSRLTLEVLEAAVTPDADPSLERVNRIRLQRESLIDFLTELGVEALPSQASFVGARFEDAAGVRNGMASLGIAIRGFPGRSELDTLLRTTMPGDEKNFDRLVTTFRTVLRPEALLFDLDGVIADESVSYRRAIIETAATFGVDLEMAEVGAAKAGGDANNDWELTRRLLADHGVEAELEAVTTRFEAIYQGTDQTPGLHRHERLLVDPDLLRDLAERLPLAIVTGRPRGDADRFLDAHGIRDFFSAVVVLDDAPSKPDPAPVRLALERLGLRHAWMVGDTPDDLRAARGASVLPLGIVAPGDDPEIARPALASAGAARILDTLDQLLEILP